MAVKVFKDVRMPVTHEEGDRYPLTAPKNNERSILQMDIVEEENNLLNAST